MSNNRFTAGGVLLGLGISAGLILSSMQITRVWLQIADSQVIVATGSARLNVTSDLAIWSANYSVECATMVEAQKKLKEYNQKVTAFFDSHKITNAEISAITIQRLKTQDAQFAQGESERKGMGYHLQQNVRFQSGDIRQVMDLQRQSVSLVEDGVELNDMGIEFLYTKTAEAKIEMLAEATRDARQRAEQIASQGGRKIKYLKSARMGVFQVTAITSSETTSEGLNDTVSKDKSIRAVVSANFCLE